MAAPPPRACDRCLLSACAVLQPGLLGREGKQRPPSGVPQSGVHTRTPSGCEPFPVPGSIPKDSAETEPARAWTPVRFTAPQRTPACSQAGTPGPVSPRRGDSAQALVAMPTVPAPPENACLPRTARRSWLGGRFPTPPLASLTSGTLSVCGQHDRPQGLPCHLGFGSGAGHALLIMSLDRAAQRTVTLGHVVSLFRRQSRASP